jgi:pimeloyl-ACP methyl ester carboxylesterase
MGSSVPSWMHWTRAERPRQAVVLAHGVMSHAGWFAGLTRELALRGTSSIAVDRYGSGVVREHANAYDADAWVEQLLAAIEALRAEQAKVSLFGWCWGARTAILAARKNTASHLVLAAPGLAMTASVRARQAELVASSAETLALPFPTRDFSEDAAICDRIDADALAWTGQPRRFLAPSLATRDDALASLSTLKMPIAALLAGDDRIVDNHRVSQLLAGHPIETLRGGHALVLESPALVAERVVAAIAT